MFLCLFYKKKHRLKLIFSEDMTQDLGTNHLLFLPILANDPNNTKNFYLLAEGLAYLRTQYG